MASGAVLYADDRVDGSRLLLTMPRGTKFPEEADPLTLTVAQQGTENSIQLDREDIIALIHALADTLTTYHVRNPALLLSARSVP